MNQQFSLIAKISIISGILFCGTAAVVCSKFMYEQKAIGKEEYGLKKFNKSW